MNLSEIVLIPVPIEHVATIIRFRDGLVAGEFDPSESISSEARERSVELPGQGRWTASMVVRLQDRLTYPLVRSLLDTCAQRPNEWVTKAEIDALGGKGPLQLRNELSAFSKLVNKLYGRPTWPIEYDKSEGGFRYRMSAEVAEWWRSGGTVSSTAVVEQGGVSAEGHHNA